jgi:hypothetical protein
MPCGSIRCGRGDVPGAKVMARRLHLAPSFTARATFSQFFRILVDGDQLDLELQRRVGRDNRGLRST